MMVTRRFDDIPLFFLLLATLLLVQNRPHGAVLASALGVLFKFFPLVGGIAALRFARELNLRGRLVLVGLVPAVVVLVPLWWIGRDWFTASFTNMLTRPGWETPWALLDGFELTGGVSPDRLNLHAAVQSFDGRLPGWLWAVPYVALLAFYSHLILLPRPSSQLG